MTNKQKLELALNALKCLFGLPDKFTGEGGDVAVWRLGGSYRAQEAIKALEEALASEQELALQKLHDENERLGLYKDAYGQQAYESGYTTGYMDGAIKAHEAKQEQGEPVAVKRMLEWAEGLKRLSDQGQYMNIPSELSAGTCYQIGTDIEQFCKHCKCDGLSVTPQPSQKPLTDEQLMQIYLKTNGIEFYKSFARAIEAAHGIKE